MVFSPSNNTAQPFAAVTEGSDEMLYGTTYGTGSGTNLGAVFRIGRDGNNFQVMHFFTASEGDTPSAPVIECTNGVLYGTTWLDGTNDAGSIYSINKDGSGFAVIHFFNYATNDGAASVSALLQASDGLLYGTAQFGGNTPGSDGVVFRLDLTGTNFNLLHSFTNSDGIYPQASLIEGTNGLLYGTTYDGGISNAGTVFSIDKDGSNLSVIHNFAGGTNDGVSSYANLLKGPNGKLYGTTVSGGQYGQGIAFSLDYNGSNYTVLHNFGGPGDGQQPYDNLVLGPDGNLYGATYTGRAGGTVFHMNADGSNYVVTAIFTGTNGLFPNPLIVGTDGEFYGTCNGGGLFTNGNVFTLTGTPNIPDVLAAPLNLGGGWRVSGRGTPNGAYTLLATTNLLAPGSNWMILGPVNADDTGNWQFDDLTNSPQRFYRTSDP